MKKSRPAEPKSACYVLAYKQGGCHTYYQALHLVFSYDFHTQRFRYFVVVFEGSSTRRHDTQIFRLGAIVVLLVGLQLAHELYACVYPVRLELEEV
jgi:hypothetical protein